jgi:hypothetical protein
MPAYHFDLRADLPKVRAAYDAGLLQMQKPDNDHLTRCAYVGPCAIGVMLPEALRHHLPQYTRIHSLLHRYVDCPVDLTYEPGQTEDMGDLQSAHDDAVMGGGSVESFGRLLTTLEAKYPQVAA